MSAKGGVSGVSTGNARNARNAGNDVSGFKRAGTDICAAARDRLTDFVCSFRVRESETVMDFSRS
jgi:hypothetical protein